MHSIYLITPKEDDTIRPVQSVYTQKITARLKQEAGLVTDVYINRDNIDRFLSAARGADAAFSTWSMPEFSKEEIAYYFPNLKAVFYSAGSVKSFALPFLESGVRIFSAYAANAVPVAQYTAAQIVLANKGFFLNCNPAGRLQYAAFAQQFSHCPGNYRAKVGLLGAGAIGRLVIKYLAPYDLDIFVYDPFLTEEAASSFGVKKASLDDIFETCGVISNHLADVPETKHLINDDLLRRMRPYTTLINTGRGAQLDEAARARRLEAEPTCCALLDVTDPEPPEEESPLYRLPNVFITPHIAGSSGGELVRMAEYMLEEFHLFAAGKPANYEITKEMLATMA